ncbi:hypothetical protein ACP4OV_020043 [Aristida adscensionis]
MVEQQLLFAKFPARRWGVTYMYHVNVRPPPPPWVCSFRLINEASAWHRRRTCQHVLAPHGCREVLDHVKPAPNDHD